MTQQECTESIRGGGAARRTKYESNRGIKGESHGFKVLGERFKI